MLAAVNLDRDLQSCAVEIEHIRSDRMLATKTRTLDLTGPQL
jgi:hypothetical protein